MNLKTLITYPCSMTMLMFRLSVLLFICSAHISIMAQSSFPSLTAETLSGKKITFPEAVKGRKALLVIAFERQAQAQADDWYDAYTKNFQSSGYVFYELPMISGFWKWMSGFIDSGMRSGVPSYKHDNVATYYGPLEDYYKAFGVKDKSLVYVFVLNEKGEITGRTTGAFDAGKLKKLSPLQ